MNLLTARETAALLRCSTRQLYRLSERPDFPRRYTIGRSVRWESGEVEAWLRAFAQTPAAAACALATAARGAVDGGAA